MKRTSLILVMVMFLMSLLVCAVSGAQDNTIELKYDDRKELSQLLGSQPGSVTISNQNVTSTVAGTFDKDANVLLYENGILYAVGTGSATLTVDGTNYTVTVSPATLSLFMITGHSIGAGEAGTAAQSIVCEAGQAYSTTKGQLSGAAGGLGYGAPVRATSKLDAFAPGGGGTKGIDSGVARQWNKLTGEKVWVMNLAISGSCLNEWQPGAEGHNSTWKYPYDTAMQTYRYAQQIIKNEIAAGHYTLGNMAIIYHNGANFTSTIYPSWTMDTVEKHYDTMWSSYKADLALDIDGDGIDETVEALGMIPSWKPTLNSYAYDKPAGYYMSASSAYPDIFIASNATRDMLTEEGLKLFPAIDYSTQSSPVVVPESILHTNQGGTSDNSLFCAVDKAHLSQVTYNYVGMDAATNLHAFLRAEQLDASSVEFKNQDHKTITKLELAVNEIYQLIPLTTPVYGKNVTFETSGAISLEYPLQIKATAMGSGTLTAKVDGKAVATVSVDVTEDSHVHCICGGHTVGIGDHSCSNNQSWIPWGKNNSRSLPATSGYYYLTEDIQLSAVCTIPEGQNVHLCLNGHTITSSARVFSIKGTLTLTDCSQDQSGTVISSSTTNYGAVFYCYKDSVFNLYGGMLTTTGTNLSGAVGTIGNGTADAATMNMYGGKIIGGKVTHRGGNLYVISLSVLNIFGGIVENGTTDSTYSDTSHGGNIYISNSTVNVNGGTVTGGTSGKLAGNIYLSSGKLNIISGTVSAGSAANGGNIAIAKDQALSVSGGTLCDGSAAENGGNIYTDGGTVNISGGNLTGGTGVRGGSIYVTDGKLNMSGGTVDGGKATTAAGNIAGYNGSTVTISGGIVKNGNATTYGGNISLSGKSTVNISGSAIIKDGYTGTSGTTGNGGNIFGGYSSTTVFSTINISGGTISGGKAKEGGNIKVDGNGYITGGNIEGGKATSGGSIYRTNRSICELVISGGTISGGSATNGGNIYVTSNGRLTINNGLITNGTATGSTSSSGGNIYGYFSTSSNTTSQSIITINGGQISNGSATNTGGNIEIEGTGIITGGTISGGSAKTGGNIYLDVKYSNKVVYSSITMTGGTIENGEATYGGNLQTMGNFTMSGGIIKDGTANYGGNIRVFRPSVFTMTDGTISGGTANYNGGNIQLSGNELTSSYAQNATMNIEGGSIEGGYAKSHGGNIYISHFSDLNMSGGIIKNGRTGTAGGNIAMYPTTYQNDADETIQRPSSFTMTGGTITGGNASRGGNIGVRYDATSLSTLMLSGTITDGTAAKGGNVYLANHVNALLDGAALTGGTATETGDNIYITRSITTAGTTDLTIKGDTVLDNANTDLYLGNASDTETCRVNLQFQELSGKDKIIRTYASKKSAFATADADYSKWLVSSEDGYKVTYDNGTLSFEEDSTPKTVSVYKGSVLQAAYASFAHAAEVAGTDNYIKLQGDTDAQGYELTDVLWIDMCGYDLRNLTVSGTLYGMDSTTDSYSDERVGMLYAVVTENGSIQTYCKTDTALLGSVKRYLAVPSENNAYSFHRFYVGITKITMKPTNIGIGYKAVFAGSDTVKACMDSYGYNMWITEDITVTKAVDAEKFVSLDELTLRIDNFLDPNATAEENTQRANSKVNANVFIKLSTGEIIESNSVSYSFMDIAELTSAAFDSYNDTQKAALISLGTLFNDLMFDWAVPNIHHQDKSWSAWTEESSLPTTGKIYLQNDVTLTTSATMNITAGTELTICLNGHTIESNVRIWNVYGTLNICDCCHKLDEDKQGYIISNSSSLAPVLYAYYGSVINLYSGNITAANTVSQGGVIALGNDKVAASTGSADTVFNMYGGHIYGGNATKNGGNLVAWHGGTFNMYGGLISGGKAGGYGGNIYVTSGTNDANPFVINLYGGIIEGGYSTTNGGNIYTTAKSQLHIHNNAVIKNGTAAMGGNIYNLAAMFTMDGGLVTGGKAENGGNLAFTTAINATMDNATISNGTATACGGNIYIFNDGNYTLNNMNIVGGKADNDGGNLYIYRVMYGDTHLKDTTPVIVLNDTTVTDGTAQHLGSGIYNMEGALTLSGSTLVTGNNGSNLYLDANQLVNLENMTEQASVGITMAVAGKVSYDTQYAHVIVSDNDQLDVALTDHIILQSSQTVNVPPLSAYSIGWHRGIVTSPFPVPLDGMGKNVERMDTYQVVSELEASLVVIADEDGLENAVVLCTMDTIVIPEEFSNAIAAVISDATGIPADRVFVSGTHTHAAVSIDENHPATRDYLQWLYPLMAQYAVLAVEDLAPVDSTQMIRTNAENMTQVRRYVDADGNAYSTVDGNVPSDAIMETAPDTELQAIRFARYGTTGKNDVILVNFQSHPGHDASASNGKVSSEMWGTFRESVENQMPNTVCGFFIGAAGNQTRGKATDYVSADGNTYNLSKKAEYGAALAAHLIKAFDTPTQINTEEFDIRVEHYAYNVENWYEDSFSGDRSRPLNLHAVSIGDFAFVTAPYEMFHENGEQLKNFVYDQELFDLLFVITNANGANKYIASYQAFENDETDGALTSFEVKSTRFNKGMAEALITAHGQMLATLSGKEIDAPDFLEEAKNP